MPDITVGVRDLAQFCFRSGDIDHRFSPSPTGPQGVEGHQRVYRRRPDSYRRELPLEYRTELNGLSLLLRGRADGHDPTLPLLEEIKTCRIPFEQIPPAVTEMHLSQARLYAAMLALAPGGPERVLVRLTWFNIDSGEEQPVEGSLSRDALRTFLQQALKRFSDWVMTIGRLRQARDRSAAALAFPHGAFRPGQRDIAELSYRCADRGGQLLVEAPTGIGKTAAVLFPAVKALAAGKHDAVAFVTARVLGRRAAEQALDLMRDRGLECNALSLSARDSVCLSPGRACHPDDCPYAAGYYDRLPAALEEGIAGPRLRREELLALARSHQVCPWQLGLDFLPWVDLVIADLHYLYSLTALLAGRMGREERRWSVLLDEAHNLPGRARGLFRAELAKREILAAKREAPAGLKAPLERINRVALDLQKETWREPDFDWRERPPARLADALAAFVSAAGEVAAEDPLALQRRPALRELLFQVLQYQRVMEHWGEDFRFELHRGKGPQALRLVLNCLDPARLLAGTQSQLHSVTAFSATLSPPLWARRSLGLGAGAVCSRQPSPFDAGQLVVHLATGIDTRYRSRAASLPELAALLARWLANRPGNCIIYFPSYRYLQDALAALADIGGVPGRSLWVQQPESSGAHPELLERLALRRDVAAFCILGGAFGEGIDLPGEQLTSVVVVGVGLPQVNRDTEALRQWHQERGRDGFAHAYLYPGMQRVDQALGRVVRAATDRGHALLVDSRYGHLEYRRLLPPWWTYVDGY